MSFSLSCLHVHVQAIDSVSEWMSVWVTAACLYVHMFACAWEDVKFFHMLYSILLMLLPFGVQRNHVHPFCFSFGYFLYSACNYFYIFELQFRSKLIQQFNGCNKRDTKVDCLELKSFLRNTTCAPLIVIWRGTLFELYFKLTIDNLSLLVLNSLSKEINEYFFLHGKCIL